MDPDDENAFIEYLRINPRARIFKSVQKTPTIVDLRTLPPPNEPFWYSLNLYDEEINAPPKFDFYDAQKYYYVCALESEIIEFARCRQGVEQISLGRLWVELNGWSKSDPARLFKKSDTLRKWFNRLSQWIKTRSTMNSVGNYIMPGAARFAKNGGKLIK